MPTAPAALVDALQDRYCFDREIGAGGMATVWLAHDLRHDRDVALKVLRPELGAVLGAERFLREIRLTAKLSHPHLLPLLDSGTAGGLFYYVMPFVEGESLRQRLGREHQLPIDEALRLTTEIAEALDYAHQQGIIHRDIKPENILLSGGHALLADFGIALAVKEAGGPRLTETGLSLGTPQYMSPEQATGDHQLDARSDVYSLGAVLYEMLTGEPPHSGSTAQAVIAKLMMERPTRVRVLRDTVPEGMDAAISRALARVPVDRFSSAAEFVEALRSPASPRATWPRRNRRVLGLVGGASVVAAVVIAILVRATHGPLLLPIYQQLTFTGTAIQQEVSPDGKMVAYVSDWHELMVQPIDGGEPTVLIPEARYLYWPRWTRDGQAIVFLMFRDSLSLPATYLISAKGGSAQKVFDDISKFDAGPGVDSIVRQSFETRDLEITNLRSGAVGRRVRVPDSLASFLPELRLSPDGRWLVYEGGRGRPVLLDLRAVHPSPIALPFGGYRWSRQGDALYILSGPSRSDDPSGFGTGAVYLRRATFDASSGRLGTPELIAGLPTPSEWFGVSLDRKIVYSTSKLSTQVQVWSRGDGDYALKDVRDLTAGTRSVSRVAISDDGRFVAYSLQRDANLEVEVLPFEGGEPRVIASSPADESYPSWSPDGSLIAFFRGDSLMVVAPSSDANPRRVGTSLGVGPAAWSADGNTMAYLHDNRGPIVVVDLRTGREMSVQIPDSVGAVYDGDFVVLSPDGTQIIISAAHRGQDPYTPWLLNLHGERWRHLTKPFGEWVAFRWNRDGSIYLRHDAGIWRMNGVHSDLWRMSGPDGKPVALGPLPNSCYFSRSVSRDGHRLACTFFRSESDLYVAAPSR